MMSALKCFDCIAFVSNFVTLVELFSPERPLFESSSGIRLANFRAKTPPCLGLLITQEMVR